MFHHNSCCLSHTGQNTALAFLVETFHSNLFFFILRYPLQENDLQTLLFSYASSPYMLSLSLFKTYIYIFPQIFSLFMTCLITNLRRRPRYHPHIISFARPILALFLSLYTTSFHFQDSRIKLENSLKTNLHIFNHHFFSSSPFLNVFSFFFHFFLYMKTKNVLPTLNA